MQEWTSDPYFKKRLAVCVKEQEFFFDTAALLFSPHEIDQGSLLLLRTILDRLGSPATMLDLACSYGVIGIVLARFFPQASVVLGDKDLLALRYARHNAELNGTPNVALAESIGVTGIPAEGFDVIVSNIPTKIGDRAIEHDFILRPLAKLAAGGSYWFVAESQLNRLVPVLGRKHRLTPVEIARHSGHIVYRIKKS